MLFDEFINKLSLITNAKLTGEASHKKIAPSIRHFFTREEINKRYPRLSAVLFLFIEWAKETCFVLIERTTYDGFHSGQISFTGGKKELTDNSLEETALREAFEEIGINKSDIDIKTKLSEVYVPSSNFIIHPFIAISKNTNINFKKDLREIKNILIVKLSDLFNKDNIVITKQKINYLSTEIEVPCFVFSGNIVWGATAMILQEFIDVYNSL